jgi:hypothetical protein
LRSWVNGVTKGERSIEGIVPETYFHEGYPVQFLRMTKYEAGRQ